METPISPREFIKRFHLPQLVRISSITSSAQNDENPPESHREISVAPLHHQPTTSSGQQQRAGQAGSNQTGQVRISASSSCSAGRRHEPRDPAWTYAPGNMIDRGGGGGRYDHGGLDDDDDGRQHEDDELMMASAGGSKSLHFITDECASNTDGNGGGGAMSLRMLPRVKLQPLGPATAAAMTRRDHGAPIRRRPAIATTTTTANAEHHQHAMMQHSNRINTTTTQPSSRLLVGQPQRKHSQQEKQQQLLQHQADIKLMPPSKRPTLSKLQLEQPFLLCKAYRKLEVCTYAIDSNNELNDKSGDPIYFPHNYQGWFSISTGAGPLSSGGSAFKSFEPREAPIERQAGRGGPKASNGRSHLETIDQVCQSGGQIFLTRDEMVAYQLPSQLSNLTKLKNNQLLAVPLAINLDCAANGNGSGSSKSGSKRQQQQGDNSTKTGGSKSSSKQAGGSGGAGSISDLQKIVVGAGRVLRICGIYEDVLPLIGATNGKQAAAPGAKRPSLAPRSHRLLEQNCAQPVAPSTFLVHQQQVAPQQASLMPQQPPSVIYQHNQMTPAQLGQQQYYQNQPALVGNHSDQFNQLVYNQRLQQHLSMSAALYQGGANPPSLSGGRRDQLKNNSNNHHLANGGGFIYGANGSQFQAHHQHHNQQQQTHSLIGINGLPNEKQQVVLMNSRVQLPQPVLKSHDQNGKNNNHIYEPDIADTGVQPSQSRRYARCALLNDLSLDQLTGCSSASNKAGAKQQMNHDIASNHHEAGERFASESTSDQDEIEVLIPLEQAGRFYLCVTTQTIANELQCHDCSLLARRNTPHLVFRLSQIVYLLNLNKRLSLDQKHRQQQAGHWRPFSSIFTLPLQVKLVIGPRPSTFSPAMFGPTSTMESYFSLESNVGGHSLACAYNKSCTSTATAATANHKATTSTSSGGTVTNSAPNELAPPTSSPTRAPVCLCPRQLVAEPGGLVWFSATLRLESVSKRDVLLACTIKQDPLVHLDLIKEINSAAAAANSSGRGEQLAASSSSSIFANLNLNLNLGGNQQRRLTGRGTTTASGFAKSTAKLDELRESFEMLATGDAGAAPTKSSAPKSSMNRLRACRSLISLNGRRKKKRSNIPSSMLLFHEDGQCKFSPLDGATSDSLNLFNRLGVQLTNLDCDGNTSDADWARFNQRNASLSSIAQTSSPAARGASVHESIVLIELDCTSDNEDLKLARTFVEHSLPTASIPDLVVNRMNYCLRNSSLWERQLKLSNVSLSRDFDSCRRQLAQMLGGGGGGDCTTNQQLAQSAVSNQDARPDLRRMGLALSSESPSFDAQQQTTGPASLMFIERPLATTNDAHESQPASIRLAKSSQTNVSNSTASSRSSSGVSSSGERQLKFKRPAAATKTTTTTNSIHATGDQYAGQKLGDHRPACGPDASSKSARLKSAARSSTGSSLILSGCSSATSNLGDTPSHQADSDDHRRIVAAQMPTASCVAKTRQVDTNSESRSDQSSPSTSGSISGSHKASKTPTVSSNSRLLRLVRRVLPALNRPAGAANSARGGGQHPAMGNFDETLSSSTCSSSAGGHPGLAKGEPRRQQRRLMEELNGRFRGRLVELENDDDDDNNNDEQDCDLADDSGTAAGLGRAGACGVVATDVKRRQAGKSEEVEEDSSSGTGFIMSGSKQAAAAGQRRGEAGLNERRRQVEKTKMGTLMNSQKVHRRLRMSESMRHLPSELLNRMLEGEEQEERSAVNEFRSSAAAASSGGHSNENVDQDEPNEVDDDDDVDRNEDDLNSCKSVSDSSHLYESLERLNASLATDANTACRPRQQQQQQEHKQEQTLRSLSSNKTNAQLIKQQHSQLLHKPAARLCPKRTARNAVGVVGSAELSGANDVASRPGLGDDQDDEVGRPTMNVVNGDEHEKEKKAGRRIKCVGRKLAEQGWRRRNVDTDLHYSNNRNQADDHWWKAADSSSSGGGGGGHDGLVDTRKGPVSRATSGQPKQLDQQHDQQQQRRQKSRPISSWRQKLVASVSGVGGQHKDNSTTATTRPSERSSRLSYSMELFGRHNNQEEEREQEEDERRSRSGLHLPLASSSDLDMEPVSIEACDHHNHQSGRNNNDDEEEEEDYDESEDNDSKSDCSLASSSRTTTSSTCSSSAASSLHNNKLHDHHQRPQPGLERESRRLTRDASGGSDWPAGRRSHDQSGERSTADAVADVAGDKQPKEIYVNLSSQAYLVANGGGQNGQQAEIPPNSKLASRNSRLIGRMERKLAKLRGRQPSETHKRGSSPMIDAGRRHAQKLLLARRKDSDDGGELRSLNCWPPPIVANQFGVDDDDNSATSRSNGSNGQLSVRDPTATTDHYEPSKSHPTDYGLKFELAVSEASEQQQPQQQQQRQAHKGTSSSSCLSSMRSLSSSSSSSSLACTSSHLTSMQPAICATTTNRPKNDAADEEIASKATT